jgi:hypothetical protein
MLRLRRKNIELREQLRELGASPAAPRLRNAPAMEAAPDPTSNKAMTGKAMQALDMIKNFGK